LDKKKIGLPQEAKVVLGANEYVKVQLKVAEELIFKARWAESDVKRIQYLLSLKSVIDECIKAISKVNNLEG